MYHCKPFLYCAYSFKSCPPLVHIFSPLQLFANFFCSNVLQAITFQDCVFRKDFAHVQVLPSGGLQDDK